MQDDDLDRLLALAAKSPPTPTQGLMDRVLSDALSAQPVPAPARPRPSPQPQTGGLFARLAELFGGTPALAGIAGAALLGLGLGYLNPAALDLLAAPVSAETDALDLFPTTDFLASEG